MQTISGPDVSINVSRVLAKVESVIVTLEKSLTAAGRSAFVVRESWNAFFSSTNASSASDGFKDEPECELELQLQIGSKLLPE